MASNRPPFEVEDNSDDDFFDKLVNDDDDGYFGLHNQSAASSSLNLNDENESEEAKAFANLNISDLANSGECNFINDDDFRGNLDAKIEPADKVKALESDNSFSFEKLMPGLSDNNEGAEVVQNASLVSDVTPQGSSDLLITDMNSGVSGASGVKEVDWSAFHTNSVQNSSNGFGSYSDFFSEFNVDDTADAVDKISGDNSIVGHNSVVENAHQSIYADNLNGSVQYNESYSNGMASDQSSLVQDLNSSQYWEDQYPGWKYDASSGQWFQVDSYNATLAVQENTNFNSSTWGEGNVNSESLYVQQNSQSITGAVTEVGLMGSVYSWNQSAQVNDSTATQTNWNEVSEVSSDANGALLDHDQASYTDTGYPPHMVFDPQYPGWYYDTNQQKWLTLESYTASATIQNHMIEDSYSYSSPKTFSQNDNAMAYSTDSYFNRSRSESFDSQVAERSKLGSISSYKQPNTKMWLPETVGAIEATSPNVIGSYQNSVTENLSNTQRFSMPSHYFVDGNSSQYTNVSHGSLNELSHFSADNRTNQNSINFSQPMFQNTHTPYVPSSGRSSAGRPSHALVAFGFGGKLVVMKPNYSSESFVTKNHLGGQLSILNLAEVASANFNTSIHERGTNNHFEALCQHPVPGPLTNASGGMRELNKWIDERIANIEHSNMNNKVLQLLLSLLKIACQHYGKLRSPYGTDVLKESDSPESSVARLFLSLKENGSNFSQYGTTSRCLQQLPPEGRIQSTAVEVQKLLVSGRKKEALQCAQEGQLWGPAIVLAAQLGDQFYVETVKQMALRQLVSGSPLRTLCLLISGCPADVFSADSSSTSSPSGAMNMPQETMQRGVNGMLDEWEENLAIITANRTKDDELVLIHLGDCLWKERSDIIAAHICYLVAEVNFESYSDSARFCLLGADHWKSPRTYATAEAIQRTEIYEYSKTLGNSQYVLLPFQPYKFVYAMMLMEVGKISEALKYCQAVLKSLKTGRTPEAENLRHLVSSLEERIKGHQQGGFSTNLAPKEFIGKLLNLFDSTAQRVVGGIPPSAGSPLVNDNNYQAMGTRVVSTSQSTMAMSSLVPSQSMEPISEWASDGNRKTMHTRSVSEPDFGRNPMKDDSLMEASSSNVPKPSVTSRTSRFASFNFGSQFLQKTVGLVLRQGRQAKLGESNKFYYDEKLKRWIEEGAVLSPAEETLPPPPINAVFHDNRTEFNATPELKTPNAFDNASGMPPLPPTTMNQYSSRGRIGVRSRYVDTFNQGVGNTASSFRSLSAPFTKPNTNFFMPASVDEPNSCTVANSVQNASTSPQNDSSQQVQRFGSMNSIENKAVSDDAQSRRSASWSGSFNGSFSPPKAQESMGEVLNMQQHPSGEEGTFGDELDEVEL